MFKSLFWKVHDTFFNFSESRSRWFAEKHASQPESSLRLDSESWPDREPTAHAHAERTANGYAIPLRRHLPEREISAAILGTVGTGKTTLINTFTNFFRGKMVFEGWDHLRVMIPTAHFSGTEPESELSVRNEADISNQGKAQTQDPMEYKFRTVGPGGRPLNVTLFDSPGAADPKGTQIDQRNFDSIVNTLSGIPDLNAVIIVLSGAEVRMTVTLKTVVERLRSFVPKSFLQNVLVVFTQCSEETCRWTLEQFKEEFGFQARRIFYADNSTFLKPPESYKDISRVAERYAASMGVCKEIVDNLCQLQPISTLTIKETEIHRKKLKADFAKAQTESKNLQQLQSKLAENRRDVEEARGNARVNQDYVQSRTVPQIEWVPTPYYNTVCFGCSHLCHEHCRLDELPKGSHGFSRCAAFARQSICTRCGTGKCGPASHEHRREKPVLKNKTVRETIGVMKRAYDSAKTAEEKKLVEGRTLVAQIMLAKAAQNQVIEKIKGSCRKIYEECPFFNFAEELDAIIRAMEADKAALRNIDQRNEVHSRIEDLKAFLRDFNFVQNQRTPNANMQPAQGPNTPGRSELQSPCF